MGLVLHKDGQRWSRNYSQEECMRNTTSRRMVGLDVLCFACLFSVYWILFLLVVQPSTAAEPRMSQELCSSKSVSKWLASVITEDEGVEGTYRLVQINGSAAREKVIKEIEATPFRPDLHAIVFIYEPANLGIHIKTGVSTCESAINIMAARENPTSGLTVLELSSGPGFYYRVVPPNQQGTILVV